MRKKVLQALLFSLAAFALTGCGDLDPNKSDVHISTSVVSPR